MKQQEIKELLEKLEAYRPLGTPEEIRDALTAASRLLEAVNKIHDVLSELKAEAGLKWWTKD